MTTKDEVKLFDLTEAAIAELDKRFSGLTIRDIDDKEGYKVVREARLIMKGYRVDVDKRRKELNEEALAHQKRINAEAKKITDKLVPIETYLSNQEEAYENKLAEIKRAEQAKIEAKKQERTDKMISVGFTFNGRIFFKKNLTHPVDQIHNASDEGFMCFFNDQEAKYKAEQEAKRIAEEEQAKLEAELQVQRDEENRKLAEQHRLQTEELARQRAEQEAQAKALADKEAALKAESDRLEAEKLAQAVIEDSQQAIVKAADHAVTEVAKNGTSKSPELEFEVTICGTFKARGKYTAPFATDAREMALNELHCSGADSPVLRIEFEQSDVEVL